MHAADLFGSGLRAIPAFRGKARLVHGIGRFAARLNGGTAICEPVPGAILQVYLRDRIQRLMWGGCWERQVSRVVRAILLPGDVFVDVGAHIGFYTLIGAHSVGNSGHVFSFEADPLNYSCLKRHAAPYSWIQTFHTAVWETSGTLRFERSSSGGESGWGTVTNVRTLGGEQVDVPSLSLDDWLTSHPLTALRLIKLDAEGSEPAILRGAKRLLDSLRPVLILEFNDVVLRQGGSSASELGQILRSHRYALFEVSPNRITRVQDDIETSSFEVLAVPSEQESQIAGSLREAGLHL